MQTRPTDKQRNKIPRISGSLKSFAAVYCPHMTPDYHTPRTMLVHPKIFLVDFRIVPAGPGSATRSNSPVLFGDSPKIFPLIARRAARVKLKLRVLRLRLPPSYVRFYKFFRRRFPFRNNLLGVHPTVAASPSTHPSTPVALVPPSRRDRSAGKNSKLVRAAIG